MAIKSNNGSLLENRYKTDMSPLDLFDRIVNLKLYISEKKEGDTPEASVEVEREFIIRSDFEIFYPSMDVTNVMRTGNFPTGRYIVRKCQYKPSIKVQYGQVSAGLVTQIDFYLSNFFILGSDGRQLMQLNMKNYRLTRVDVMLGYYSQFKAGFGDVKDITAEELFDFSDERAKNGVTLIKNCLPLYVATDKLPPDYDLHISCDVGNVVQQPFDYEVEGKSDYGEINSTGNVQVFNGEEKGEGEKSDAANILFHYITKRFANDYVLPKGTKIERDENGLMSDEDAEKYGVKAVTSPNLDKWKVSKIKGSDKDEVNNEIYAEPTFINVGNCIVRIKELFGLNVSYKRLDNGDLAFYLSEEEDNIEKLAQDMQPKLEENFNKTPAKFYWKNKLPAVNNITSDVITMIVCPFFFTLQPFQFLQFKNRYAIGDITSYIADYGAQVLNFFTISMQFVFATVEDLNEVEIKCAATKVGGDEE